MLILTFLWNFYLFIPTTLVCVLFGPAVQSLLSCAIFALLFILVIVTIYCDCIHPLLLQLDKDMQDKKEASRTGGTSGVGVFMKKMQYYTDELKHEEGHLGEMTHNLDVVKIRLKEVDDRLRQLHPGIRLDTLENRCKGKLLL